MLGRQADVFVAVPEDQQLLIALHRSQEGPTRLDRVQMNILWHTSILGLNDGKVLSGVEGMRNVVREKLGTAHKGVRASRHGLSKLIVSNT